MANNSMNIFSLDTIELLKSFWGQVIHILLICGVLDVFWLSWGWVNLFLLGVVMWNNLCILLMRLECLIKKRDFILEHIWIVFKSSRFLKISIFKGIEILKVIRKFNSTLFFQNGDILETLWFLFKIEFEGYLIRKMINLFPFLKKYWCGNLTKDINLNKL